MNAGGAGGALRGLVLVVVVVVVTGNKALPRQEISKHTRHTDRSLAQRTATSPMDPGPSKKPRAPRKPAQPRPPKQVPDHVPDIVYHHLHFDARESSIAITVLSLND